MPIKFPKFSRRKSAGNALEAGYEPANQGIQLPASEQEDHHDGGAASGYGGSYGGAQRQNRGSGNTSGSGYSGTDYYASTGSLNRLSSSSTLPSADAPRTPASLDDHQASGYTHSTAKSTKSTVTTTSTGSSQKRSVGGLYGPTSPRRGTMSSAIPPKLETSLDTSSIFGDDMFSFGTSKGSGAPPVTGGGIGAIPHTAPKLASTRIINTSDNHNDISPVPPPKSYDPMGTSPTNQRFSYTAYSNVYATHMDGDRPATGESPYGWGAGGAEDLPPPVIPAASNNSPRNSRNLTPGQNIPAPNHSHTDSLTAPRQGRPSRQHPSRGGSADSLGLKRSSAVMRRSSFPDDEDAALVAQAAASHKNNMQPPKQQQRSQTQQQLPSALLIGGARGLTDKVKDRDSGWEEAPASGSSSVNSYPGNSSSSSSHDTRGTSPAMSRGNTDPEYKPYVLNDATPRAIKPSLRPIRLTDGDEMDFDASISASASLAAKYENLEQAKPTNAPNKVMTPAQFERYRQEQDNQRRLSGKSFSASDDESVTDSEEESEAERNKMAIKQRQKQEAHLSVYRQQMMKITGSQPMEQPLGMLNAKGGSMSTSMLPLPLNQSMPQLSLSGPGSSGKSSEEEDEEIPLGILMAHGFPAKNRPPTRLSNASSQPNLRQAAQQQDSRLPPFARNLPADPYNLGASIINPTNRMSFAYGGGSDARSITGGSVYGGMPPSAMPGRTQPGGLIGEIMRTEEMKAARKGGASTTFPPQRNSFMPDPFGRPSSPGGGMLGLGGGMQHGQHGGMGMNTGMGMGMGGSMPSMPSMPGNLTPTGMGSGMGMPGMQMPTGQGDQVQMQMANQMQQMMQMQMQWMQMQMQMQNPQQQQPMLNPPAMGQQRPMSMANSTSSGNFPMIPPQHQRTMSMMEPLPLFQGPGYAPSVAASQRAPGLMPPGGGLVPPGYTPSIAPSERSTVGLPSRYRPVSYAPPNTAPAGGRATTLGSGTGHDWNRKGAGPSHLKNSGGDSDEDDESAWEELEKKKKEKKDGWKKKKETGLKGMLNFGSGSGSSGAK